VRQEPVSLSVTPCPVPSGANSGANFCATWLAPLPEARRTETHGATQYEQVRSLGEHIREAGHQGESSTGLGMIRFILLSGFRRHEALGLERSWLLDRAVNLPDTKLDRRSGQSVLPQWRSFGLTRSTQRRSGCFPPAVVRDISLGCARCWLAFAESGCGGCNAPRSSSHLRFRSWRLRLSRAYYRRSFGACRTQRNVGLRSFGRYLNRCG
jgi:hypothetical protein